MSPFPKARKFLLSHPAEVVVVVLLAALYIYIVNFTWEWWHDFHAGMITIAFLTAPGLPLSLLAILMLELGVFSFLMPDVGEPYGPIIFVAIFYCMAVLNWFIIIWLVKKLWRYLWSLRR
ncbi:MAG: hypothetical protein WC889_17270 [Myxococcota bacterium]|jgi:hypothetical protein